MRGGKRHGAGRKRGIPNKRTQQRLEQMAEAGLTDPFENQMVEYSSLVRAHDIARANAEEFARKHAKKMAAARLVWVPSDDEKAILREHDRLVGVVDELHSKVHATAVAMMPFLYPRLAATEAKVEVTTHEKALDELDDD